MASGHPNTFGLGLSNTSNPPNLSGSEGSSKSTERSPDQPSINPSFVPIPHQNSPNHPQPQPKGHGETWGAPCGFMSDIKTQVNGLVENHPILQMVAQRNTWIVHKIVECISLQASWELQWHPWSSLEQIVEESFNEVRATAAIHPLIVCAFQLPYQQPQQHFSSYMLPVCLDLHESFLSWVDRSLDPQMLLQRMLIWLHFGRRPLSAKEFRHAVLCTVDKVYQDQVSEPPFQHLSQLSGGLLTFSEDTDEIEVHQLLKASIHQYFSSGCDGCSASIVLGCLAYIKTAIGFHGPCVDKKSLEQRLLQWPFLAYAVENWHHHLPPSGYEMKKLASYLSNGVIRSIVQIEGWLELQLPCKSNIKHDPSQWFYWNTTRLSYAASIGYLPLVKELISDDCDPRDGIGRQPPLVAAAMNGHLEVVNLLLSHGADVNVRDFAGRTPLFAAVFEGHTDIIKRLLLSGMQTLDQQTIDGMTPLMAAICNGNLVLVDELLDYQAKVFPYSKDGQTALSYALAKFDSPEAESRMIRMFEKGLKNETWHSDRRADFALFEAISKVNEPNLRHFAIDWIQRLEFQLLVPGRPHQIQRDWLTGFLRRLPTLTHGNPLAGIGDTRKKLNIIPSLSNGFRRRYMLENHLASGAFSSAWKAINLVTGRYVAVKFLLEPDDQNNRDNVEREHSLMSRMNHPNVLKCLDLLTVFGESVIVTEFAEDGDIYHRRVAFGFEPWSNKGAWINFQEIIRGLAHMHSRNIIHRDLKTANILMFMDCVKIADFGNSKRMSSKDQEYVKDFPCTATHIAPEAIVDEQRKTLVLGKPCDIWSAGVCLYELLAGVEPWLKMKKESGEEELHAKIREGDLRFDDHGVWATRDDMAMHLLARMLNPDPLQRPTAEQVLEHPWFTRDPEKESLLVMDNLRTKHGGFKHRRPEWVIHSANTGFHGGDLEVASVISTPDIPPGHSFQEQLEEVRIDEQSMEAVPDGYR